MSGLRKYKSICIGIISWFPDNEHRSERVCRCQSLVQKCNELFDVPIIIIAQNWRQEISADNIVRYSHDKLGITKARKALWEHFKKSKFDWMICFDDDSALNGSKADAKRLLDFLSKASNGYLCNRKREFKLCAFHKSIAISIEIPDLDVTQGTGIEDYAFFRILEYKLPGQKLEFEWRSLADTREWLDDKTSSWNRQILPQLLQKTSKYLKALTKGETNEQQLNDGNNHDG